MMSLTLLRTHASLAFEKGQAALVKAVYLWTLLLLGPLPFPLMHLALLRRQVCPAVEKAQAALGSGSGANLVEVGPRACLNPILIFSGAFGGGCYLLLNDVSSCF